jgi:hypothetical protein
MFIVSLCPSDAPPPVQAAKLLQSSGNLVGLLCWVETMFKPVGNKCALLFFSKSRRRL